MEPTDAAAGDPAVTRARRSLPSVDAGAQLRGVTKSFGATDALVDVDLIVAEGAITTIVGPSGSGKTTALRLIAGLEAPDDGMIFIGGEVVAGPDEWVPAEERRVGFVFQHLALFPHLTVAQNIGYGVARPERRDRVAELLDLIAMTGYERRRPRELSAGEAQRVALARALAPRPQVLLLDEPFSSLDPNLRGEVRAEVARIVRTEGTTTVLVTHDQDEALSMGDRVAVLLNGRVVQVATPEDVYRAPATPEVAAFLGDANILHGEVRRRVLHTAVGALTVAAPFGPSVAVIRPEELDVDVAARGNGRVLTVEYFGAEQRLSIELDSGETVRALLRARRRFEPGARVRVRAVGPSPAVFRSARRAWIDQEQDDPRQ